VAHSAVQAIQREIERKQAEINALNAALETLGGSAPSQRVGGKGTRRPRTAAEKKAMSKAMKAAWRRRKAAKAGPVGKGRKSATKKTSAKKAAKKAATTAPAANG
jgi:hypothetical protein